MRLRFAFLLGLLAAAPLAAFAEGPTKVGVAPFAALTGDVPPKAGAKAATMLLGELKNVGTVTPVEVAIEANEPAAAALKSARESIAEAEGLRKKRKFGAAATAYKKAISQFDAGASLITEVNELSDAHVALGTVLYLTGDDVGGAKELWNAIALTPTRPLPGESTSPLFTAAVKKIHEKVLSAEKSQLRLDSVPSGATVLLDGGEVGRTPINLKDIPPGKHLWQVLLPTSEPVGATVMLGSGQKQKASAALVGSAPITHLNQALAANKLDDAAVAAAKQLATNAGVDLLVFGALHGRGQDLVLASFLYSLPKNSFTRLEEKTFDSELLSAGMELFKIAGDVGGRTSELGKEEKTPGKVAIDVAASDSAQVTEVAYALPGAEKEGGEVAKKDEPRGPRKPVDPNKKDKPAIKMREREK